MLTPKMGLTRVKDIPGRKGAKIIVAKQMSIRARKGMRYILSCPYRKPTQVDMKKILRPTGEGLLRNSAK